MSTHGVDLVALLHTAYDAQAAVEAELSKAGLSMAKLLALKALDDAGGSIPLGQLADRLACVKSNITQLVDRLESSGLVARQADPHDRRTRLAVLTAAGHKACQQGSRLQRNAERELLAGLSRDERLKLARLLAKLKRDPK